MDGIARPQAPTPTPDYKALFEAAPSPCLVLAPDFRIQAVNTEYLKATSTVREDIIGRGIFEVFPDNPDDPAANGMANLRASLNRVLASGQPDTMAVQKYDIPVGGPDGSRFEERYWNPVNLPIFGRDGQLEYILHRVDDVTTFQRSVTHAARIESQLDRQAIEIELANRRLREANSELEARVAARTGEMQKEKARYHGLFDSIDEGFCILEMLYDAAGTPVDYRFLEINAAFVEQTGMAGAVGKRMLEMAPSHEKHWFDIYGEVARTGNPIRFENEARALGRWYDVYAFRVDSPGHNEVAVLFKDIAERKRTEAEIRRSEHRAVEAAREAQEERRRIDALLQAAPAGIIVFDADGKVQLVNAAHRRLWGERATGFAPGERRGWWADSSGRHGQPLGNADWASTRVLRGEEAPHDIVEIETLDTPPLRRIVLITGAPVMGNNGAISGAVVTEMDITQRVRAEEALRQGDRRKDEFLAMLAHELRNPLSPIGSAADLLAMGRLDQAGVRQTSEVISRQVRHMTALVDDLLDVSRVTRGLITLERTRLDARRIVAEAVEQVRPLIEKRRHTLTLHTPPEPAFVSGDQKRLIQVVTNLLNNAAKYTPLDGKITVGVRLEGEHVRLAVSDNGIGMTPDVLAHAFELFSQAERTSDRSQGGLGIGLALVKSLVELHGGEVSASSDPMGKGSTFTLSLPRAPAEEALEPVVPPALAARLPSNLMKVMVVDDNTDAAQMLAMFVGALGHEVSVEYSSLKALARARVEQPDVFLLDIGLPDMDGNELARRLRADPATANAQLVAVTGYGQEQDRERARAGGFDHHFVKPVDTAKLAALLQEISEA